MSLIRTLDGANFNTIPVHISVIKSGDTILFNGQLKTVCNSDIKSGFMGVTLFGDSFKAGHMPVEKVEFI